MFNTPFFLTSFSLLAFAANSVFCRLALGDEQIDAGSFTIIRLASASFFLALILFIQRHLAKYKKAHDAELPSNSTGSWRSAFFLFVYAVTFSYAYIQLDTATGALVLFATVQVTMLLVGLYKGRKLLFSEWAGLLLAVSGFIYLLAPQLQTPSLQAFILMCISGICWAFYTLAGKESLDPSRDTIFNFIRTIPLLIPFILLNWSFTSLTVDGVVNAVLSGVLASALGYLMWYKALTYLSHHSAAVLQLLVPVLAAVAGLVLLNEILTGAFFIASFLILGGILLVIKKPKM